MSKHGREIILAEAHSCVVDGNYEEKETTQNILRDGLWSPTLHEDAREYGKACDICQRIGKNYRIDEMPLVPQVTLQALDK